MARIRPPISGCGALTRHQPICSMLRCKKDLRELSMPIGEFGRPPGVVTEGAPVLTTPLYWMYEMGHAALNPSRAVADATRLMFQNPMNPLAQTEFGKSV